MGRWRYKLVLDDIFDVIRKEDSPSYVQVIKAAKQIAERIKFFREKNEEFRADDDLLIAEDTLKNLDKIADEDSYIEEFDNAMTGIYDFGDWNDVWIQTM